MPPAKDRISGWSKSFSSSRISEARTCAIRSAKRFVQGLIGVSPSVRMEGFSCRSVREIAGIGRGRQLAAHDLATPRKGGGYLQGEGEALAHSGRSIAAEGGAVTVQSRRSGP